MNCKQLISKLQKLPKEAEIEFNAYHDNMYSEIREVKYEPLDKKIHLSY